MDSGSHVHVISENELICVEEKFFGTSKEPTSIMTANGMAESTGQSTVHVTDLDVCHYDYVGRFICSDYSGFICARTWDTLVN